MKPVTLNTYLRHLKTYYKWQGKDWKVPWLKEEQKVLPTLSADMIKALIAFKPKGVNATRAHAVAVTILDTGVRLSEVLSVTRKDINFDSLIMRVLGKGQKERLVPFSFELRKFLWKYVHSTPDSSHLPETRRWAFPTQNHTKVTPRNFHRDFKELGKELGVSGVRWSAHTLRHSFAVHFLRRGGDIYSLSRILGHKSVKTTEIYLRSLGIEDLQRVHRNLSPLGE